MQNIGNHLLLEGQQVLAQGPVQPNKRDVPFQDALGGLLYVAQYIGLGILAIAIVGACVLVVASKAGGGNSELNYRGKSAVLTGFVLAAIIGGVPLFINAAFGFGQTITP